MAAQELVQFRVDGELKKEAGDIFKEMGLDIPTACRMFLAKSKAVREIPFEMTIPALSLLFYAPEHIHLSKDLLISHV